MSIAEASHRRTSRTLYEIVSAPRQPAGLPPETPPHIQCDGEAAEYGFQPDNVRLAVESEEDAIPISIIEAHFK